MEDLVAEAQANLVRRQFNAGSPWNVVAGEGGADLRELMKHYDEKAKKTEEARAARIVDGKVTTVYDDTTGGRWKGFPFSSKAKEPTTDS